MRVVGSLLVLVVLSGLGILFTSAFPTLAATQKDGAESKESLIKHGDYLVNKVARCGDCHTPRDKRGKLDNTRLMQGAKMWFRPVVRGGEFEDHSPDITFSGRAGKWNEDRMINYLMKGGHKGEKPEPPMPPYYLNERDAKAVTAYLRSLKGNKGGKRGGERDDD